MGFIDFTNGEVLTADQMDLVMRQGVMRFADAAARDTALSEVLAEGMMAYLDDTDEVLKYDGTSWIDISGDITGVTAGTALTGGGTSGNVTLDVDESALTIAQSQVTDLVSDLADKQDDVITTQGDLVIGDASGNPVRLPVGSADQVLTSDGTTVSFQDAGGGGGTTLLASGTFSGNTTITSIDQSYKSLILFCKNVYRFPNEFGMQFLSSSVAQEFTFWEEAYTGSSWSSGQNDDRTSIFFEGYDGFPGNGTFLLNIFDYASSGVKDGKFQGFPNFTSGDVEIFYGGIGFESGGGIDEISIFVENGEYELYGVN